MSPPRRVAVFDGDLLTSIAFVRSLGRAGVPVQVFGGTRRPAAARSRYASSVAGAPEVAELDAFVDWLTAAMDDGRIDLVAPTSDLVAYAVAEAHRRLGRVEPGHAPLDALLDCLVKSRFAERLTGRPIEAAPSVAATSTAAALAGAERLGWPVVLKPRSHLGVGLARGTVVADAARLREAFAPYPLDSTHRVVADHDADLAWPLVQRYFPPGEVDVVSITGCLDGDGDPGGVGACRKTRAWPPGLGVGSRFEALPDPCFASDAVDLARAVLGVGLFELEILVHRPSGERWAIDLNPRAWGQIGLDVAAGRDRPRQWYASVTGAPRPRTEAPSTPPTRWQFGAFYYPGALVAAVGGPHRGARVRELARGFREPAVGALKDWRDPVPALALTGSILRHPARLARRAWRNRILDQ